MAKSIYKEKAKNLSQAIDIAIATIQEIPPKGFNKSHIEQFIDTYLDAKNKAINPEPQFANTKSLKYIIDEVFTYFQEASGETVNVFWKRINENELPYKRKNKLAKIFKRKKIKNKTEYDFVIDVILPYQQEGLINEDEVSLLNTFIKDFEEK